MEFQEAIHAARDGKQVRRKDWPVGMFVRMIPKGSVDVLYAFHDGDAKPFMAQPKDAAANDWEYAVA